MYVPKHAATAWDNDRLIHQRKADGAIYFQLCVSPVGWVLVVCMGGVVGVALSLSPNRHGDSTHKPRYARVPL